MAFSFQLRSANWLVRLLALGACLLTIACSTQNAFTPSRTEASRPTTVIPLTRLPSAPQHPFIRATVHGRSGLFLVDTGATITCLDSAFVQKIGLETSPLHVSASRTNVTGKMSSTQLDRLQIGSHTYRDFPVVILDLSHLERALHQRLDGIIGINLLRLSPFELSPTHLTLGHPAPYGRAFPILEHDNLVSVQTFAQGRSLVLKLDTGSNSTLIVPREFNRLASAGAQVALTQGGTSFDVNGTSTRANHRLLIAPLQVGPLVRNRFPLREGHANLLGMDFFRGQALRVDINRKQAWLRPAVNP